VRGASIPGTPSIISPAGPDADAIAQLWWVMLALAGLVYVVTLALLGLALVTRRRSPGTPWWGARWLVLGFGVGMPVVVLAPLTVLTLTTMRETIPPAQDEAGLVVEVTGYQFWWEVRYPDAGLVTANEVHVPVGVPVEFRLASEDVIHSFWVPRLAGKLDMIPGRVNSYRFSATEPGVYEGICAEFCGIQHAKMHFVLVAHEQADYDTWLAEQLDAPAVPDDPLAEAGREVFLAAGCGACHTVQGTSEGQVGPDLTTFASRRTLAAGLLDNVPGNRAGWVLDPQSLKQGANMPPSSLTGPELQSLLAYLDTLE
jgi:cytochrome c oxidase subunit 2